MPMCSSRVLFGLESIARAGSRDWNSRADVFESSPVGGCNYKRYIRYISTDEQKLPINKVSYAAEKNLLINGICNGPRRYHIEIFYNKTIAYGKKKI